MTLGLGPFDLYEIAGRGGMGEVWRGGHRALGVPVAVKVLTAAHAREEEFVSAFRNEARAVAALAHPNVIGIFDYGQVLPGVEGLTPGSPYLVTEWASGGTLAQHPPCDFDGVRAVLLALLAALAHAHAHHVVHRDLKPSNVALCDGGGLKLVDFGIARRLEEGGSFGDIVTGTPSYMAPEQLLGASWDEGPWTDLYALGCVAYRLVAGRLPFRGTPVDMATGHLHHEVPPLEPLIAVPVGFERWLLTLLAKEPASRFRLAADAAFALRRLGDAEGVPAFRTPVSSPDDVTVVGAPSAKPAVVPRAARGGFAPVYAMPPIPETWRADDHVSTPVLPAAGLGVFGVREIPLVDRERERDALWLALRRVTPGSVRLVVLHGPSGCGKSRLARWLGERASELGAATAVRVAHDPERRAGDHLGAAFARWMGCEGVSDKDARVRVEARLASWGVADEADVRAVLQLVRGQAFGDARERYETARRLLAFASSERPVVVWLDDVHCGEDSLAFAQHALGTPTENGRVLFAATLRDDATVSAGAAALLSALRSGDGEEDIFVGPLPAERRAELVRGMLGLDRELAARVEERTGGVPSFAVQLVGDWVERGVLEPAAQGYRLRQGSKLTIPDDLALVWQARIDAVLGARPGSEGVALELAAVLGQAVDAKEWEGACALVGVPAAWTLVEKLLDLRFATCGERGPRAGWELAPGPLRDGIERRARIAGRLARHHGACAEMLRQQAAGQFPERYGRHLRAAGDPGAALAPLLLGARARYDMGEARMAAVLLREYEEALAEANVAENDERRGRMYSLAAHVVGLSGTADEAARAAERAERAATRHGWPLVRAEALVAHGRALVKLARPDQAETLCREALETFRAAGQEAGAGEALHWLGIACVEHGRAQDGLRIQRQALELAERRGDRRAEADALYELAIAERHLSQGAPSHGHLRAALERNEAMGRSLATANTFVHLGEEARLGGELISAEQDYRRALVIYERIASPNAGIARLNLGLALLAREQWSAARRILEQARAELERGAWRAMLACAHVELSAACAGAGDWPAQAEHFARALGLLADAIVADADLAWAAGLTARLARGAGHVQGARAAFALARDQWASLGRVAERDGAERELAALVADGC